MAAAPEPAPIDEPSGPSGERTIDRRVVLKAAALATLTLAGCSSSRSSPPGATTTHPSGTPPTSGSTSTTARALTDADWQHLRASLVGRLVRPSDAGYDAARRLYDPRYDGVQPAAVAYCANPTDVQRSLAFARAFELPLSARSGGHSYGGYSTSTGLVIDVTTMSSVTVTPGAATIGAGARLIDVYSGLNAHGVSIPGGSCPTVGIAGLTLGGGIGVVGRQHGLTCDRLSALQVVTADGRLITADRATNADLFWACQGGGGGNFGIVVSLTFETFPTSDVTVFFLHWPWAAAGQVLPAWIGWASSAPDELWSNCVMQTNPGQDAQLQVGGVWLGPAGSLSALLDQLARAAGGAPSGRSVEATTFAHAMYLEGGCADLTQDACHLPGQTPGGVLPRSPSLAASSYIDRPLDDAGVRAVLAGIDERHASGAAAAVGFDSYGGAINRLAADATAFVHRGSLCAGQFSVPFAPGDPPAATEASQTWLDGWYASIRPHVSPAAYQNYIDPHLTDWAQAYYGTNLSRLQQVKRRWDPDDVFRFAQSIPLP